MSSGYSNIGWGDGPSWPPTIEEAVEYQIDLWTAPYKNYATTTTTNETTQGPKVAIPQFMAPALQSSANGSRFTRLRWSKTEIKKLVTLRGRGLSFSNIADQMPGRTESACTAAFHRYIENKDSLDEWSDEEIPDLRDEGERDENSSARKSDEAEAIVESSDVVSEGVNSTSMETIFNVNHHAEADFLQPTHPVPQPWTEIEDLILLEMISEGSSFAELHACFPWRSLTDCYRRYRLYYNQGEINN